MEEDHWLFCRQYVKRSTGGYYTRYFIISKNCMVESQLVWYVTVCFHAIATTPQDSGIMTPAQNSEGTTAEEILIDLSQDFQEAIIQGT